MVLIGRLYILAFFLFFLNSSSAQNLRAIDSIVVEKMNKYKLPGLALGIVVDGEIFYHRGYGLKDFRFAKSIDSYSVFHTASISKLFTALAVRHMVDSHLISFSTSLKELDLNLRYRNNQIGEITIGHLLNHFSGLYDVKFYNWRKGLTDSLRLELYFRQKKLKLKEEPGKKYSYNNLGYNLLALIIQKTAKETFEDFIKKNVLLPSKMYISDFRYFTIPDSLRVSPHTKDIFGRMRVRKIYPYTREHAGSSTLNSNAAEICEWMKEFLSQGMYLKFQPDSTLNKNVASGFQLYSFEGKQLIGHYGGDKGFRSFLCMMPSEKIGIVVLANADFNEDYRQDLVFELLSFLSKK